MTVTIKAVRFISPDEPAQMEDVEALSNPDAPLVITRCFDAVAVTHKPSGKKVYLPSSLAAARLALPELLKLTDWSVSAAELEKNIGLKALVEAVQDAANKQLEDDTKTYLKSKHAREKMT